MSARVTKVLPNFYLDSIMLFKWTEVLTALPGVELANVTMGVPFQLEELERVGLADARTRAAMPNDLVVAVRAQTESEAAAAHQHLETLLRSPGQGRARDMPRARTIARAVQRCPDANVAFISVPGSFAAVEAHQALARGLSPVIFSDHVALADEVRLKQRASDAGLMVMGPDCGTAMVGELALGFVNEVERGCIGVIAASGTGAQEVSVLIDAGTEGISHIIGVGGRDMSQEVGARSTLGAIDLLARDPATDVLVVLSKAPSPGAIWTVTERLEQTGKPWVALFLGSPDDDPRHFSTLEGVARAAVALAQSAPLPAERLPRLPLDGRSVFAAFQGGSLAAEARFILGPKARIIDFGAEDYTTGSPHPIIDPRQRDNAIAEATVDASVEAILADLLLGHNAHPDPAPSLAKSFELACELAGRTIDGHVRVVGTKTDPQDSERSEEILRAAGWTVHASSTEAALAAGGARP